MAKKYVVTLTAGERAQLQQVVAREAASRRGRRAQVLLMADEGATDQEIAEALGIDITTVERTRKRMAEEGVMGALEERPRSGRPKRQADGRIPVTSVDIRRSGFDQGRRKSGGESERHEVSPTAGFEEGP
jgi:DNA-binding CsgD family transcriptional regulator